METKKNRTYLHRLPHGLPADRYDGGRRGRLRHRQHLPPGRCLRPQRRSRPPTRIVTSTVRVTGGTLAMVSCKTRSDIPKGKIF